MFFSVIRVDIRDDPGSRMSQVLVRTTEGVIPKTDSEARFLFHNVNVIT